MYTMSLKRFLSDKYNLLEVIFFITYYLLFSVLSRLEYNFIENRPLSLAFKDFPEVFLYGIKAMLSGLFFYKFLIQRYLLQKKYILFVLSLPIFLIFLNLYTLYSYLLISKLSFLPEQMTLNAAKWYNSKALLHFSIIYMIREFLVFTALAYFIQAAKQDRHIAHLGKLQLIAERDYLKTQIQPHFFFNTLNNIYALTLQQSAKAAPLVAKHADIMRYMLYVATAPTVTLQKEAAFLRNYIEVEAVRYSEQITIDFAVQGIQQTALIATLLLLPFVENTFKHGIREELNEGFVVVVLSQIGDELSLEVSNSKSVHNLTNEAPGIGLKNVKKRLDLLYPNRHSLVINDEPTTYTIFLTLKLDSE